MKKIIAIASLSTIIFLCVLHADVWQDIRKGFQDFGEKTKSGFEEFGRETKKGFEKAGTELQKFGQQTKQAFEQAGREIQKAFDPAEILRNTIGLDLNQLITHINLIEGEINKIPGSINQVQQNVPVLINNINLLQNQISQINTVEQAIDALTKSATIETITKLFTDIATSISTGHFDEATLTKGLKSPTKEHVITLYNFLKQLHDKINSVDAKPLEISLVGLFNHFALIFRSLENIRTDLGNKIGPLFVPTDIMQGFASLAIEFNNLSASMADLSKLQLTTEYIIKQLINGIVTNIQSGQITQHITNIKTIVETNIKQVQQQITSVTALMQGLTATVNNLKENVESLKNLQQTLKQSVENAAKSRRGDIGAIINAVSNSIAWPIGNIKKNTHKLINLSKNLLNNIEMMAQAVIEINKGLKTQLNIEIIPATQVRAVDQAITSLQRIVNVIDALLTKYTAFLK